MAVIAVGDFDPAAIEAMIVAHFGRFRRPPSPRPRTIYTVPPHAETLYSLATDPEATATTVSVSSMMAAGDQRTVGTYRQQMVERLFARLLSARLDEIAHAAGRAVPCGADQPRHSSCASASRHHARGAGRQTAVPSVASTALFTEAERVVRFGFTATELDREKLDSQRYLDEALLEKDKSPSGPLADEFVRNFVQDEPIPGIVYEQAMSQRFLPEITLAEINALARSWIPETQSRRVGQRTRTRRPRAAHRRPGWRRSLPPPARLRCRPTSIASTRSRCSPRCPRPARWRAPRRARRIGVTEWQLSNGASRHSQADAPTRKTRFCSARSAPAGRRSRATRIWSPRKRPSRSSPQGGLGPFSTLDLNKVLAGTSTACAGPTSTKPRRGCAAARHRKDVEKMFQLIYLTFTAPRRRSGRSSRR